MSSHARLPRGCYSRTAGARLVGVCLWPACSLGLLPAHPPHRPSWGWSLPSGAKEAAGFEAVFPVCGRRKGLGLV